MCLYSVSTLANVVNVGKEYCYVSDFIDDSVNLQLIISIVCCSFNTCSQ